MFCFNLAKKYCLFSLCKKSERKCQENLRLFRCEAKWKKCLFQFVKPSEQIFFVVLFFSDTFSESDWNFFSIIFLNSSDKRNERNYEEKKILQRNIFHSVLQIEKELWKNIFTQEAKQKKKNQLNFFLGWIPFLKHLKHSEKQNLMDFFSPSFTQ